MSHESHDSIVFIQVRSDSQRITIQFELHPEIVTKAKRLILHGYEFIARIIDGNVELIINDPTTGIIAAEKLVENDPAVKESVEHLIAEFHDSLFGAPQPEDYE